MKKNIFFGQDLNKLERKYGTPFFLFSEKTLIDNYRNFIASFSKYYKNVRADYSVKTDYEIGVLKVLANIGATAEVVSGFEIELCTKAGFDASKITFDGPYKPDEDIKLAIRYGIHAFYADSGTEFERVNRIAKRMNKIVNIGLRVNLGMKSYLEGPAETYITKFGEDYDEIKDILIEASEYKNLRIIAISTHIGSQILNPKLYEKSAEMMVKLARDLADSGIIIKEICLGGGFPSQTLIKNTLPRLLLSQLGMKLSGVPEPIETYAKLAASKFSSEIRKNKLPEIQLVFQPGRSVSSSMGIVVSKAVVVKKKWVFLDVSTSSLPESIFFAQRRLVPLVSSRGKKHIYSIAGKGLNSSDNFLINESFPEIKVGDLVLVLDAGAYSISRANRFTTLNPPVYMVKTSGKVERIRRNENFKDVLGPMEL